MLLNEINQYFIAGAFFAIHSKQLWMPCSSQTTNSSNLSQWINCNVHNFKLQAKTIQTSTRHKKQQQKLHSMESWEARQRRSNITVEGLVEIIVLLRLMLHLVQNDLMPLEQLWFTYGKLTTQAIIYFFVHILNIFESINFWLAGPEHDHNEIGKIKSPKHCTQMVQDYFCGQILIIWS